MQNFRSKTATVIELRFFMKKQKKKMIKSHLPVFRTSCDIFIQFFACSYFLHVLHLRSQIELKLKVNILMYGYNAGLRRSRRVNESIVLCYSFLEKYQFSCKISGLLFTWFTCCDVMYGLHYNVLLELIIIYYTRSKRVNGKIICLLRFFMKKQKQKQMKMKNL